MHAQIIALFACHVDCLVMHMAVQVTGLLLLGELSSKQVHARHMGNLLTDGLVQCWQAW